MDLGQIHTSTTIRITTKLNRKVSGLSDVLIDIYDSSEAKLVDGSVMTEIGATGIYAFGYGVPSITGTYTVDINCASQRDYNEIQTFTAIKAPGAGGGMVVQYPAKVVDKKEQKRRKEQKELMIAIDAKLTALIKKNPEIDFTKVNDEIKKRTKELGDNMKSVLEKKEESLNKEINQIKNDNNKGKKELVQEVADFTDKIYQLQENTKLLPNSLNSLLTSAETAQESMLSKMQSMIKGKFDEINEQTSKFNSETINSSGKLSVKFDEKFNQVENKLSGQIDTLPKFISDFRGSVKSDVEELAKKINEGNDSVNNLGRNCSDYKKSSDKILHEYMVNISNNFETLLGNLSSLDIKGNTTLNENIKNIGLDLDNVNKLINEVKEKNIHGFKNVEKTLTKIPTRRDINYTQEEINKSIKDVQSNNTKKIKTLRENIEGVSKEIKESKNEQIKSNKNLTKKIELSEEENNLNAQLALLSEGEND